MPTFNYVSNTKLLHYFVQSWFCTEADLQALGIASVLVASGSDATRAGCKMQGVSAAVFQCGSTHSFIQVPGMCSDDPVQPCSSSKIKPSALSYCSKWGFSIEVLVPICNQMVFCTLYFSLGIANEESCSVKFFGMVQNKLCKCQKTHLIAFIFCLLLCTALNITSCLNYDSV